MGGFVAGPDVVLAVCAPEFVRLEGPRARRDLVLVVCKPDFAGLEGL